MLKEGLETLIDKGRQLAEIKTVRPEAEPKHVYLYRDSTGVVQKMHADIGPREHIADDLEALIAFVNATIEVNTSGRCVVWYSPNAVVAVLDDDKDRRNRVVMSLPVHPAFATLCRINSDRPSFSQRDFVRLLRIELAGTLGRAPAFLQTVRNIKILRNESGSSVTAKVGRESIGRSVEAELSGAGDLPEEIDLEVSVFAARVEDSQRYRVPCAIDVNVAEEKFQLIPLPDRLEEARVAAVDHIGERLAGGLNTGADKRIWIMRGQP